MKKPETLNLKPKLLASQRCKSGENRDQGVQCKLSEVQNMGSWNGPSHPGILIQCLYVPSRVPENHARNRAPLYTPSTGNMTLPRDQRGSETYAAMQTLFHLALLVPCNIHGRGSAACKRCHKGKRIIFIGLFEWELFRIGGGPQRPQRALIKTTYPYIALCWRLCLLYCFTASFRV